MLQPTSEYHTRKDLMEAAPSMSEDDRRNYFVDLREIAKILRRRRWIVIVTTLALLAPAILFVLIATPRYTATSTVLIDPNRSNVVESNNSQSASSAPDDGTVNSQVSLMQSIAVLQRVVDNLNLAHDPEFGPHSSILDRITGIFDSIKGLFGTTRDAGAGTKRRGRRKGRDAQLLVVSAIDGDAPANDVSRRYQRQF